MRRISVLATLIATSCGAVLAQAEVHQAKYIGECWMEEDGTIRMFLRAEAQTDGGTIVGHALQQYRPGDEHYEEILKHVGPMRPGDRRPVPAWPD